MVHCHQSYQVNVIFDISASEKAYVNGFQEERCYCLPC